MEQLRVFGDERQLGRCAYCGGVNRPVFSGGSSS